MSKTKLINWHQDFTQELAEVSQANIIKEFEQEQKQEARELLAQRIMAYVFSGLFIYLLALAIFRSNLTQ
jgi:hypothetical protein